jgi:hypothetical protein
MMGDKKPGDQPRVMETKVSILRLHEIFFVEFPCLLHEWIKRQTNINSVWKAKEWLVWDQETLT